MCECCFVLLTRCWGNRVCPAGLKQNADAKQVRKRIRTDILYQIGIMVRKSILTFRTKDFIDFVFEGLNAQVCIVYWIEVN